MPYKDKQSQRDWDSAYRLRRSAKANQGRVSVEEKVIKRVRDRPGYHDVLSLYISFRRDKLPVTTVALAVADLVEHGVFTWTGGRKEAGQTTPRLTLTNRAKEVWTPRPNQFGGKVR